MARREGVLLGFDEGDGLSFGIDPHAENAVNLSALTAAGFAADNLDGSGSLLTAD